MKMKMSNKAFRAILIPIVVILSIVLIVLNVVCANMGSLLDTYISKGSNYVKNNGEAVSYYDIKYSSADEAKEAAYEVAAEVQKEGSVLLKNNGILPLDKGTTVMPFGYAYLNPSYGQNTTGGSAKWVSDPVTPEDGLADFTIDDAAAKLMEAAGDPEITIEADGTKVAGEADSMLGGDCKLYEYNADIYDSLSVVNDEVGIVFLSRSGQEGTDMKYDAYEDGTPHYLALSENEKQTIKKAKDICEKVVVVVLSSATMELAPLEEGELEVDAILWMGHPGERGLAQLSALLTGEVNPSGRTVDTYLVDLTQDPSYQSIGVNTYSNYTAEIAGYIGDSYTETDATYNEYMEGVYMGYRYYETADEVDPSFDYDSAVLYPFGYGLSYTSFEQELKSVSFDGSKITAEVTVKNTGDVSGKEVVQLYLTTPYTELDQQYKIEKPSVVLMAFDKTDLLSAGESQTLILEADIEDFASYCYTHSNPDGTTGCYMLEEGDYIISLRENSHDVIDSDSISLEETTWFDGSDEDHVRSDDENVATNLFQTMTDYMTEESTILSRSSWSTTQPEAAENRTKEISDKFIALMGSMSTFDPETDAVLGNVEGSIIYTETEPVSGVDNGLTLSDLRGASYDDERWELLLDQIDWEKDKDYIIANFSGAAYMTYAIDSIGLPGTDEPDGANGLKIKGGTEGGYDMSESSSFGFAPLMAATWNTDILYDIGMAFGQESLQHGINGWYCPAINLHRSQFSGRIFEYYSEDPVLSGKLAAQVISGAGDAGMFCYVKHFALNDTETGRASLIYTWADEQTFREIYLKPFEIAIKEATSTLKYIEDGELKEKEFNSATAIMAAQNCVGTVVGECNRALLVDLLRDEWGFEGMVVSDYWVWGADNLRDYALRSGCDTYLCMNMPFMWNIVDYESATARNAMRTAIKNIAYTVVNSNAFEGAAPGDVVLRHTSPWLYLWIVLDVVIGCIIIALIVVMVRRARDEKIHPDLYKRKVKKNNKD